mgnify:CR=1 FL=1
MKKVLLVVGTRPNLIKITKFKKCFENYDDLELKILHTGQHYDYKMSDIFFDQLGIPKPDNFSTYCATGLLLLFDKKNRLTPFSSQRSRNSNAPGIKSPPR